MLKDILVYVTNNTFNFRTLRFVSSVWSEDVHRLIKRIHSSCSKHRRYWIRFASTETFATTSSPLKMLYFEEVNSLKEIKMCFSLHLYSWFKIHLVAYRSKLAGVISESETFRSNRNRTRLQILSCIGQNPYGKWSEYDRFRKKSLPFLMSLGLVCSLRDRRKIRKRTDRDFSNGI